MAKVDLVFALEDKRNPDDPVLDLDCHRRGHLLHWEYTGHQWTNYELSAPHWHIVTAELPESFINALAAHDAGDGVKKHSRFRRYVVDMDKLQAKHFERPQLAKVGGADLSVLHPREHYELTEISQADLVAATKFIAAD